MIKERLRGRIAPTVLAGALAIAICSLVMAGPEEAQPGLSWPSEVKMSPSGPTALERLQAIYEMGLAALPGAGDTDRPEILRVLRASFACAAYDGSVAVGDPPPSPLPAHAAGHQGAKQKLAAAWAALHSPPDAQHQGQWPNWAVCADELEHGH